MGFRPRIRPERELQSKREVKRHDPFSEKDTFLREQSDLVMDVKEIRLLFSLAEDGVDVQNELKSFSHTISEKIDAIYGNDHAAVLQAKDLLVDELVERLTGSSLDDPKQKELVDFFTKEFVLAPTQEERLYKLLKEGKARVKSSEELFEKLPHLQADLDDITNAISTALEKNDVEDKQGEFVQVLRGYILDLQTLSLDEETYKAVFSKVAMQVAEAWGHPQLLAESLANEYLLLERKQFGANGELYSGLSDSDEEAAVKVFMPRNPQTNERLDAVDPDAARQFQRELHVLSQVEGEHIVEYKKGDVIPDAKTKDGKTRYTGWIGMELVEGGDVKQLMKEQGKIQIPEALDIVVQTAKGLAVLHKENIVHRDVKPHNIMLDEKHDPPRTILIDFGTAINPDTPFDFDKEHDDFGKIIGTPLYIPPEVFSGAEITTKADIFALGIVLYEMLTGEHPFVEKEKLATSDYRVILFEIFNNEALPPSDISASNITPELEAFLLRMIDKEPNNRPDIEEVIRELGKMLKELKITNLREKFGNPSLEDTRSIPAWNKSRLVDSALEPQEAIAPEQGEIPTLEHIAEVALANYSYVSVTKNEIQRRMEDLYGKSLSEQELQKGIQDMIDKKIIRKNRGRTVEGYLVVANYKTAREEFYLRKGEEPPESVEEEFARSDRLAQRKMSGDIEELLKQLPEDELVDHGETEEKEDLSDEVEENEAPAQPEPDQSKQYVQMGFSLSQAKKDLLGNPYGNRADLVDEFFLPPDAIEEMMIDLEQEGFLTYDPDTGDYQIQSS